MMRCERSPHEADIEVICRELADGYDAEFKLEIHADHVRVPISAKIYVAARY